MSAVVQEKAKAKSLLPKPGAMHPYGRVHTPGLEERAAWLAKRSIKKDSKLWALRLAVSMCDLTTLEGADTEGKGLSLCAKAKMPYVPANGMPSSAEVACPRVAAVCVYPNLVPAAVEALLGTSIKVASVATGFPSGQYPLSVRLRDVRWAVDAGAHEIDMVINRAAFLSGDYKTVSKEIERTKEACRPAHLKVILETGELGSYDAVRNASFIAMHAGADFIKTSTGKINPAATLPVTLAMLEAIRDFYDKYGIAVGMKPAGGIRTAKQAIQYLVMVTETLGDEWLTPDRFRFGASSLVNDLLSQIVKQVSGEYRSPDEFSDI